MRGTILGYDFRTGGGEISGDNGERYTFAGTEWRAQGQPRAGQTVDFQADEGLARSIYTIGSSVSQGSQQKLIAALLALFLGSLGIHKFYLGNNKPGVVMLLVSIFGAILLLVPTVVMGLIAFVEAIIYLTTSEEEFQQRYLVEKRGWF